ncbi:MAG: peptidyl-prolyl cis-trans isomerase [Oscillospiraceae bacterium]|jgi:peptidyl-prolyl cis-trans isomerase D|nr:peptidyl-prolyl cis-trans isomerase [Oscillospiraceae bacterium]
MKHPRPRRAAALIAALLCAVFALSGCKLISKDPTVDAKTVIAEVYGDPVAKGDLAGPYSLTLSQYAALYSMYGLTIDTTDAEFIDSVKQSAITSVTSRRIRERQFETRGLALTPEEEAQAETTADESYESWIASYSESLRQSNASLGEASARDQAIAALDEQGITRELMLASARDSAIATRLKEDVTKDVTVSDADIETEADTRRAEQQTTYDATPASFGTDMMNGVTILYRPEGYRYVKNLLIGISAEVQAELDTIDSQLSTNDYNRYNLEQQKASFGELNEADEQTFTSLFASLDETDARFNAQRDEKLAQGKEQVKPRAEEALAKAKADGADFDALIIEYGTDPGMLEEPYKSSGYPVSETTTSFVAEFKDAAMALAQPGDVSDLVETDYGYHILLYASDIPAGDVPTSDVKDALRSEMLVSRQDELYNQAMSDWTAEANIKTYISRWNLDS